MTATLFEEMASDHEAARRSPVSGLTKLMKEQSLTGSTLSGKNTDSKELGPNETAKNSSENLPELVTFHDEISKENNKGHGDDEDDSSNGLYIERRPIPPKIERQQSNLTSSLGSLSSSIPFSAPGGRGSNSIGSNPLYGSGNPGGLSFTPNLANGNLIQSTHITSPNVSSSASIEPRFIISRQKVQQSQNFHNSVSRSGSSTNFFSRSKKNSIVGLDPLSPMEHRVTYSHSPSSNSSGESAGRHSSMADLRRFLKEVPAYQDINLVPFRLHRQGSILLSALLEPLITHPSPQSKLQTHIRLRHPVALVSLETEHPGDIQVPVLLFKEMKAIQP